MTYKTYVWNVHLCKTILLRAISLTYEERGLLAFTKQWRWWSSMRSSSSALHWPFLLTTTAASDLLEFIKCGSCNSINFFSTKTRFLTIQLCSGPLKQLCRALADASFHHLSDSQSCKSAWFDKKFLFTSRVHIPNEEENCAFIGLCNFVSLSS